MAQPSIPVDLFNPGQVFACLGFMEVANKIFTEIRAGFDWTNESDIRFHIVTGDTNNPFESVLAFLAGAQVESLVPQGTGLSTERPWNVPTVASSPENTFPIKPPDKPATLPARMESYLNGRSLSIILDHWGDSTQRNNVKFWAGSGGYPGAALLRDALDLVREDVIEHIKNPFALAKPQSSSFRFDWRRDYIPIDVGFSPNEHNNMFMVGYPIVEILAAVGLSNARPRCSEQSKLEYRYGVLGFEESINFYDPIFMRAALGCTKMAFPQREFRMQLGWPGKEGQARCIINVTEQTGG